MKKNNLNKAFRELRKAGYFARQNFQCCNSCGWYAVPEDKGDRAVFYHAQNTETLKSSGITHLSWSGDAQQIISILESNDIKTEWDGTKDRKIQININ